MKPVAAGILRHVARPLRRAGYRAAAVLLAGAWACAGAQGAEYRSIPELLAAAPAADWRTPDPQQLVYLELAGGRVIIELAPAFAPRHVANVRALAQEHWFDGLSINRVQDNYVAQWGDPDEQHPRPMQRARPTLPAEFTRASAGLAFQRLPDGDVYAAQVGFVDGFPVARDPASGRSWLAHCYGMVGAGRDEDADSGGGSELYAVIGHAPRHLDRNVTLLGRVLQGIELLSSLPRGTAELGFYAQPSQRVPIQAVRLAADLPESERTPLQVLRTDSRTFRAVIEARRNRRDHWTKVPAGHIELCNVPLPVRSVPGGG